LGNCGAVQSSGAGTDGGNVRLLVEAARLAEAARSRTAKNEIHPDARMKRGGWRAELCIKIYQARNEKTGRRGQPMGRQTFKIFGWVI
jgi:hypothetical protein